MSGTINPASGYVTAAHVDSGNQFTTAMAGTVMPDVDQKMHYIAGQNATLMAELKKMRTLPVTQMRFDYFEKHQMPRYTTLAAGCTAAATTVAVATGTGVYIGRNFLIKNERTHDLALVRVMTTDTITTMVRTIGDTTAQPWISGDTIRILGPVPSEGQKMQDTWSVKPEQVYNYCGIHKVSMAISHIADIQKLYTGKQWDQEVKDKTEMFALYEYEKFLHGERYKGTVSQTSANIGGLGSDTAAVDWVTGGMRWHAEQYATADRFVKVNGTLTWDYFLEKIIYPYTQRGSNQKGLFIPSLVGQLMDKIKYGKLEILPKDKDLNLDIAVWTIFGGQSVTLFLDRGLNVPPTTAPSSGSIVLGLDFGGPNSPAYMQMEKTHVRPITLADGTDGKAAELYNIAGLMAPDFNNHIWAEGITGVSAA